MTIVYWLKALTKRLQKFIECFTKCIVSVGCLLVTSPKYRLGAMPACQVCLDIIFQMKILKSEKIISTLGNAFENIRYVVITHACLPHSLFFFF